MIFNKTLVINAPKEFIKALRQTTSTYQADEAEDHGQRNKCPRNLFQWQRVVECNVNHDFHCKSATTKQKHGGRCKVFQTVMLFSCVWKTQNACRNQKRKVQIGLKSCLTNACLLCWIYSSPFPYKDPVMPHHKELVCLVLKKPQYQLWSSSWTSSVIDTLGSD